MLAQSNVGGSMDKVCNPDINADGRPTLDLAWGEIHCFVLIGISIIPCVCVCVYAHVCARVCICVFVNMRAPVYECARESVHVSMYSQSLNETRGTLIRLILCVRM